MKYAQYEAILSAVRLDKYKSVFGGNRTKAIRLYKSNINLSEEMLGVICMFEIALRNAIDRYYTDLYGDNWLWDSIQEGGKMSNEDDFSKTKQIINYAYSKACAKEYNRNKLLAECEFGVWRYMFAPKQYHAMGDCLIAIFPNIPERMGKFRCNEVFVYNELTKINIFRNRIAHHEPICFDKEKEHRSSRQARFIYRQICNFISWMDIDYTEFLADIDEVIPACDNIDNV